jgi:hypothetical protein
VITPITSIAITALTIRKTIGWTLNRVSYGISNKFELVAK